MNKQLPILLALMSILFAFPVSQAHAQFVGIGEANPNSKVDVVHTGTTGNTIEVTHSNTGNGSSAVWIRNSGIGRALNVQSLNTGNNIAALEISQSGTSGNAIGAAVIMSNASTAPGVYVLQNGSADAIFANPTATGWGTFNVVDGSGGSVYNLNNGTGTISTVDDLSGNGGGVANYAFFNGAQGTGLLVDSIRGAGFGALVNVNTTIPTALGIVSGAAFGGQQFGVGHGILINHLGPAGRGAEFNITNPANMEPALFITHAGATDVAVIQNQDNTIAGPAIHVLDATYTGTDVDDHIGVYGASTPAAGWGVGVRGDGNYAGVVGVGGDFGVLCFGDLLATGLKNFVIDHPQEPADKYLRHYSLESNEVLNVYRGTVTLDGNGQADVSLPDYFESVNINYTYQLTAIGTPVQPYVLTEIASNQFKVAGEPNTKVSWMVLANRNDPYVQQHPEKLRDVYEKEEGRKGKYLMPELYGQPAEMGIVEKAGATPLERTAAAPSFGREDLRTTRTEALRKAEAAKATRSPEPNAAGQ